MDSSRNSGLGKITLDLYSYLSLYYKYIIMKYTSSKKIGPISNRVLMNLLDRSFKNGSITAKEYRDLRKQYFGKPKLIQMDLFPDDPKKKQKGGLMEQTN